MPHRRYDVVLTELLNTIDDELFADIWKTILVQPFYNLGVITVLDISWLEQVGVSTFARRLCDDHLSVCKLIIGKHLIPGTLLT